MKTLITWMARVVGFVASAFFLSLVIDEGLDRFKHSDPLLFKFIPWLLLALIGYVLAWFKPSLGGRISITAGLLMFLFHVNRLDWFTGVAYGTPFVVSGVLFIISANHQRSADL